MPTSRPAIPIEIKRDVLFEARHHCAVCCTALPLEYAHVIPWSKSQDHSLENLIALCANCHERADNEKWGESYLQRYKKSPCIIARAVPPPMTVEQKALVDLIVARDPDSMNDKERRRLVSMVAAYVGVPFGQVSVVSVAQANSSRVRLEMPPEAARRLIEGFQTHDPMLQAFLDATRRPPPKCGAFRLQPRRSLLRQTGRWREADSNPRSRLSRGADLNREFAKLRDLAGGVRRRATSSQFHRIAGGQLSGLFQPAPARQAYRHRVLRREPERA